MAGAAVLSHKLLWLDCSPLAIASWEREVSGAVSGTLVPSDRPITAAAVRTVRGRHLQGGREGVRIQAMPKMGSPRRCKIPLG